MKKLVFTNQQSETFNKFKLCVIIPFRYQESRSDFEERLLYPMMDKKIPDSVCFFVVDDGSKKEYSAKVEAICKKNNIQYSRLDTEFDLFHFINTIKLTGE